jgi:hypothetical protein
MSKSKRKPLSSRISKSAVRSRSRTEDSTSLIPLPIWCHPEFHEFLDQYESYIKKQIRTFSQMDSYNSCIQTRNQLVHWKAAKRVLAHIRWAGTRNHAI